MNIPAYKQQIALAVSNLFGQQPTFQLKNFSAPPTSGKSIFLN